MVIDFPQDPTATSKAPHKTGSAAMINFDLTTLIVAIAVIAFFSILGRKLTRWRESTFEKIKIVIIMLLAGLMTFVLVLAVVVFLPPLISALSNAIKDSEWPWRPFPPLSAHLL